MPLTNEAPYKACSGFTRVTARRIARPPKVTFVARLRPGQSPDRAARQLPDLSTIIRVEPSSTDDSRRQGALPVPDVPRPDGRPWRGGRARTTNTRWKRWKKARSWHLLTL